jgi:hypothetical protein
MSKEGSLVFYDFGQDLADYIIEAGFHSFRIVCCDDHAYGHYATPYLFVADKCNTEPSCRNSYFDEVRYLRSVTASFRRRSVLGDAEISAVNQRLQSQDATIQDLYKGNKSLMDEISFLKYRIDSLSKLHNDVVGVNGVIIPNAKSGYAFIRSSGWNFVP